MELRKNCAIFYYMSEFLKPNQESGAGTVEDTSIDLPPEMNVVMYNDDFTSMDFVVEVLISVFNKSKETAEQLMTNIHNLGSAVVGTYTYDIAVSRANLATSLARKNEFPLVMEKVRLSERTDLPFPGLHRPRSCQGQALVTLRL